MKLFPERRLGFTSGTILTTVLVPHLQELGFPTLRRHIHSIGVVSFCFPPSLFLLDHDGVLEDHIFIFISIVRCLILTRKGNAVHNDRVDEAEDWMMSVLKMTKQI